MKSLAIFLCGLVAVFAQASFKASFSMYNDPNIVGVMTGTINYDSAQLIIRHDYDLPSGTVNEVLRFGDPANPALNTNHLRYLRCTTCFTETYQQVMPQYFGGTANGAAININGRQCTPRTITGNPVTTIWVDGSSNICRALYTGGKTIDFTNNAAVDPTAFTAISTWGCPAQQCNKQIDFVLVFDESGSIDSNSFRLMKSFAQDIARSYTFGPTNTGMALVMFSSNARSAVTMTFIQASFVNGVSGVTQRGGSTCIGCGLDQGRAELAARGRGTTSKVFIVLTDGQNNVGDFQSAVTVAKNARITIFAIGVAQAVPSEINFIASTIAGVQTSFPSIPSFAQLSGIVNNLVIATCIDIPGNPCGAACKGFCSCGGNCVCPSACNDGNACTTDSCNIGIGGNGCVYATRSCSDGNACTNDFCNPATGCSYTNVTCNPPDQCTVVSCNPTVGCQNRPRVCDDNDVCTADTCNPSTGCVFTNVPCDKCLNPRPVVCTAKPCFKSACNVTTGICDDTPIDCNDFNPCSTDTCNPLTGNCEYTFCNDHNACTFDFCDNRTGCYFVPYTVSVDCNDFNDCTTDTCDVAIGCVHTNVTCFDKDPCTDDTCFSSGGCTYPPVNCLNNPRIANLLGDCYQALCDGNVTKYGCYLQPLPGAIIDQCGVCNGTNACLPIPLDSNVPYVVSGVLLAILIIASIIVCAAVGLLGGKKGYDVWLKHRNNMQGASTNPLYNDNGLTGTNPMYSENA
jgi:hypothetical protein